MNASERLRALLDFGLTADSAGEHEATEAADILADAHAELNTYREAVGLPLIYIHENAKRRRRRRTVTDSDRGLPSAGEGEGGQRLERFERGGY